MAKNKGDKNITLSKWQDIKQVYIVKCKSLRELATEFDVSEQVLFIRSSEEKWVYERSAYWANIEQELSNLIAKEMVEAKRNMLKTGLYLFGKGIQHLQKKLDEADNKKEVLSDKESWAYFNKGVEILSKFMTENKNIDLHLSQSTESEAAREMRRFFDKLHGVPTD